MNHGEKKLNPSVCWGQIYMNLSSSFSDRLEDPSNVGCRNIKEVRTRRDCEKMETCYGETKGIDRDEIDISAIRVYRL